MKKAFLLILVFGLCLGLCACTPSNGNVNPTDAPTSLTTAPTNSTNPTTVPTNPTTVPTNPTTAPTEPTENKDNYIETIGNRNVQFNESDDQYVVFFAFHNNAGTYIAGSGTAEIVIEDEGGAILYEQSIYFDENDFTNWTNRYWDSSRYMCGLYINRSDLAGAASNSGTLSLKVILDDGRWFDAYAMTITNLPPLSVNITFPSVPDTYLDMRYSYTSTVMVTKLSFTTEIAYDGTATVNVEIVMKLIDKTGRVEESGTVAIGYKVYDSDGIVVDSGHIYSDPIAVGEASKKTFRIYDLDPRGTYTVVFINAS